METHLAYDEYLSGFQKGGQLPFFTSRTPIPRPPSEATDILDSENDDELSLPEDSPFTSVASFGAGSVSTASTPNEATTPDSTGLTAFDFHIDEKSIKGPSGPHLFRSSLDSLDHNECTDGKVRLQERPPSAILSYYQSASKLDPVRRDTPVPNRISSTPQPQVQQQRNSSVRQEPALNEFDARNWTPRDVVRWLQYNGFDDSIMETFYVNDISGSILLELQAQDLKELGIQSFGKRHRLMSSIQSLQSNPKSIDLSVRPCQNSVSTTDVPPTPVTAVTLNISDYHSASTTDLELSDKRSNQSRRRRHRKHGEPFKVSDIGPGDSVSIVAIEQVLPKLHSCSKGQNCRKWQKQQAKLAHLAKDLPLGSMNGRLILAGDPGNPKTAPNLIKSPKSDITPSLVASSDVMGPVQAPEFRLSQEKLSEVQPRDPQENVRNFLSFQNLSQLRSVNDPATPPRETLPSPESESPRSVKGNPTLSENLRHLPKLMIPGTQDDSDSGILSPSFSGQRTVTPSTERKKPYFDQDCPTAIPRDHQSYAYGTTFSPGDFYRSDPHYGQSTPFSEVDVPITAIPIGPVPREESQSVPPNMRFGADKPIMAESICRPASTKGENCHRRNTSIQNVTKLAPLDERYAFNPIETPEDMEKTPRAAHCKNNPCSPTTRRSPSDITHSGWMKKRKTTRLLRHEWEEHHFTLQGTQLAMHEDELSARRNSKALEYIDVDDYAVACSSLASTSKLTAAFKKTVLKRRNTPADESAFSFSLIPAPPHGNGTVDKKTLFLNSGKSHHFAVKTRDERIDWMRELMLAKALKRGRESGATMNVNGNVI
ncbi:hypothetical protein KXW73_002600 [Aspergillus fumigatus]|nr:hypothetical protein KXW73_002600 [Aspergillus fumigatus]